MTKHRRRQLSLPSMNQGKSNKKWRNRMMHDQQYARDIGIGSKRLGQRKRYPNMQTSLIPEPLQPTSSRSPNAWDSCGSCTSLVPQPWHDLRFRYTPCMTSDPRYLEGNCKLSNNVSNENGERGIRSIGLGPSRWIIMRNLSGLWNWDGIEALLRS